MVEIYFDGSCRGNPGYCTSTWLIKYNKTERRGFSTKEMGTNSEAEYNGIIGALKEIKRLGIMEELTIYGDSKLVINQLLRAWRVKSLSILALFTEASNLIGEYPEKINLKWVPSKDNLVDPHA